MSFVMAYSGIPAAISSALLSVSTNKYVIFILMNVILMIIGMFMDITPAILIFYTDLPADCTELWHERHPVWRNVNFQYVPWKYHTAGRLRTFVGCGIGHVSIEEVTPKLIPYFLVLIVMLLLVTFVPGLSLGVPSLMGLV